MTLNGAVSHNIVVDVVGWAPWRVVGMPPNFKNTAQFYLSQLTPLGGGPTNQLYTTWISNEDFTFERWVPVQFSAADDGVWPTVAVTDKKYCHQFSGSTFKMRSAIGLPSTGVEYGGWMGPFEP